MECFGREILLFPSNVVFRVLLELLVKKEHKELTDYPYVFIFTLSLLV